jgi:hypothetical protein
MGLRMKMRLGKSRRMMEMTVSVRALPLPEPEYKVDDESVPGILLSRLGGKVDGGLV